ncbi:TIGR01212 family radical SAM protein [Anaerosacchariphilus polymeriproducens]|uniref:TIGR01212 family radical SAM protein n=1 Tax=Anaerosacchariphilus polymeriproducens TaxID=1812858 RepID=A0A371AUV3_9FIRM|nr:TIGR01212 family radical SAM protein [Anaerosacchariphilus polymeriproducens]RDU23348.1 TIGR01212 family radical SAM protein [Anaerosacchariphilus polymeriproducens]
MRTHWNEKRYYSLDYYLKEYYGEKIYKLALNGGMTCPNRDGTLDERGCIFCSHGGSGDFASSPGLSIWEQIEAGKSLLSNKQTGKKYIAYFQAFTNTYAPVEYLRDIFKQAISHPDISILSIGTRPDCLSLEILDLLSELNQIKPVWIELGLQTIHESTAIFIRRGYSLSCFESAVKELQIRNIKIVVHIILGLPNETKSDILKTVSYIGTLGIMGIKLQLLHILSDTDLAQYYKNNPFPVFQLEEYCDLVIECLEYLPQDIVIHRLTGDGPKELLVAPLWSKSKRYVLNTIQKKLKENDTWQGKLSRR